MGYFSGYPRNMKTLSLFVLLIAGIVHPLQAQAPVQSKPTFSTEISGNVSWLLLNSPISLNIDLIRQSPGKPSGLGIGAAFFVSPSWAPEWTNHLGGVATSVLWRWGKKRTQGELRLGASFPLFELTGGVYSLTLWPIGTIGLRRSLRDPDAFFRAYIGSLGIGFGWGKKL